MSTFVVTVEHIRAMVNAGLEMEYGPLSWKIRSMTEEERERAYQPGAPWGPEAQEIVSRILRELTPATAEAVGAMLLAENRRSVDHRYDEDELEDVYTHAPSSEREPVEILKAIACYEYQSCESPRWDESEAYNFCQALRRDVVRRLYGYDEAEWEIDEP